MRTLLSEEFAPITSSIGFLRGSLDCAAQGLVAWRRPSAHKVTVEPFAAGLEKALPKLEPLTGGIRPRELLVETSGEWAAYFDCSLRGTDAISTMSYLARQLRCDAVAVEVVPHTAPNLGGQRGRYGAVQFQMFGPSQTEFLNYVRTVSLAFDGKRWIFTTAGTPQPFEETETYKQRSIRERFTSSMLERYCQALGIDVFNAAAYGPRAALIQSELDLPENAMVMSLREVQRWLDISPGAAEQLTA